MKEETKKKKVGFRVLRVKETFQIGPYKSPANIWQFHLIGQESRAGHVDSRR